MVVRPKASAPVAGRSTNRNMAIRTAVNSMENDRRVSAQASEAAQLAHSTVSQNAPAGAESGGAGLSRPDRATTATTEDATATKASGTASRRVTALTPPHRARGGLGRSRTASSQGRG